MMLANKPMLWQEEASRPKPVQTAGLHAIASRVSAVSTLEMSCIKTDLIH